MSSNDSLLEVYIYENLQLLEQLEGILLTADKADAFSADEVASIFRILHTIKGSSAMMSYDDLARLSHKLEDLFGFIRDNLDQQPDHITLCDLALSTGDFIRGEIEKLQAGGQVGADCSELLAQAIEYYDMLTGGAKAAPAAAQQPQAQQGGHEPEQPAMDGPRQPLPERFYKAAIIFEKDCKMENMRAFGVQNSIDGMCKRIATIPEDLLSDNTDDEIVANGFVMFIESDESFDDLKEKIAGNLFIQSLDFERLTDLSGTPLDRRTIKPEDGAADTSLAAPGAASAQPQVVNYMSVRLDRLDKLMDLVGEIVITETTVTKNPDIVGLPLDNFSKAAQQLRKLTDELHDTVMAIRMVPVSATFHKLERIVRDMGKKTAKQANLVIIGEDTEVDKNVLDNLSDPLMHIIRNSMDHGIELPKDREALGKNPTGRVVLEARNTGGDVLILVSDDGKGLDRDALIEKGIERGLVKKPPEEITDKEAYGLIFAAGFSTKEAVTEFSGRGVGMDVAIKNVQKMGGSISVDSTLGEGMTVQLRIPLTLAMIDGMQVSVGESVFIVPLLNIRESFKPKSGDVFKDPNGNEMIMIREDVYSVVRLHELMGLQTDVTEFEDGILMMIESDEDNYCLFVDALIGEQPTVIKPIPQYIARTEHWLEGIAGCTIMGDGGISLILDINRLLATA